MKKQEEHDPFFYHEKITINQQQDEQDEIDAEAAMIFNSLPSDPKGIVEISYTVKGKQILWRRKVEH